MASRDICDQNSLSSVESSDQVKTQLPSSNSPSTSALSPPDAVLSNSYAFCGTDLQNDEHFSHSTKTQISSSKPLFDRRSKKRLVSNDESPSMSSLGGCKSKLTQASGKPLFCPLCQLHFSTWASLEQHLYSGHDNSAGVTGPHSLVPVCWRCQGVFTNATLLLAHECFDWGRLHIPSQLTDTQSTRRRKLLCSTSSGVGYPPNGVFLRRRCGLCFRSSVLYTSHRDFQLHKVTTHPGGKSTSNSVVSRQRSHLKCLPFAGNNSELGECADSLAHPNSEAALWDTVRNVFYRFAQSSSRGRRASCQADRQGRGVRAVRSHRSNAFEVSGEDSLGRDSLSSAVLPSTSCHVDNQQPTTTNTRSPGSLIDPVGEPQVQVGDSSLGRQRLASWRSLVWRQKRRSTSTVTSGTRLRRGTALPGGCRRLSGKGVAVVGSTTTAASRQKRRTKPASSLTSSTMDDDFYYYHYPRSNGYRQSHKLVCRRCPAVFRLASRLRAHYLFQHGHIPKDLSDARSPAQEEDRGGSPPISGERALPGRGLEAGEGKGRRCGEPASSAPAKDNRSVSVEGDTSASGKSSGFACTLCSKVYANANNLNRHVTTVHFQEFRFSCGYCDFRTCERYAYDEHLARHFRVKQFVCESCDARFTVKRELEDHVSFKHTSERNHLCEVCGLTFKTAGTLWRHRTIHGERRLHTCSLCPAVFTRLSNLKRHLGRVHKHQTVPPNITETLVTVDLRQPGRFAEVDRGTGEAPREGNRFTVETGGGEKYSLPGEGSRASPSYSDVDEEVEEEVSEQDQCEQICVEVVPSHGISDILPSPTAEEINQQLSGGTTISEEDAFEKSAACTKQYSVEDHFLQDDSLMDSMSHSIVPVDITPVVDDGSPQAGGVNTVFLLNLTDLDSVPSLFESTVALPSVSGSGLAFTEANPNGSPSTHSLFEPAGERSSDSSQSTSTAAAFVSLFPLQLNQPGSPDLASADGDCDGDSGVTNSATGWPNPIGDQHHDQHHLRDDSGSPSSCPRTLAMIHDQNLCYLFTTSLEATAPSDVYSLAEVVHLHDPDMQTLHIPAPPPATHAESRRSEDDSLDEGYVNAHGAAHSAEVAIGDEDCVGGVSGGIPTAMQPLFESLAHSSIATSSTTRLCSSGDKVNSTSSGPCGIWRPIKVLDTLADTCFMSDDINTSVHCTPAAAAVATAAGGELHTNFPYDSCLHSLVSTAQPSVGRGVELSCHLSASPPGTALSSPSVFYTCASSPSLLHPVFSDLGPVPASQCADSRQCSHLVQDPLAQQDWFEKEQQLHDTVQASLSSPEPPQDCQCQPTSFASFWQSAEEDVRDQGTSGYPADDRHHYQECCLSNFSVGYLIGQRSDDPACSKSDEMMEFDEIS